MSGRVRTILVIVVAVLVGAWAVRAAARTVYFGPRDELLRDIASAQTSIDRYRESLDDGPRVASELQVYADRTLGGGLETADHRLRTRLNRIGEAVGLAEVTVATGAVHDRFSPARNEFRGPFRDLRDEVDLVELDGWINGEGTLEQVLRLLDVIEAEPWLKHVDQYKLESKDNGARLGVSVHLTTIFMPDRAPRVVPEATYDPGQFSQFAALVERNPFGLPAPQEAAPEPKPGDTGVPWQQWRLTGVTHGPSGPEAWLRNEHSGASQRMAVGDRFRDLVLVEVNVDGAVFEIGGERFVLTLGQMLSDRSGPEQ